MEYNKHNSSKVQGEEETQQPKKVTRTPWILCGAPGRGKSTLFNALTGEHVGKGNSLMPMSTSKEQFMGFLQPHEVLGVEGLTVCDSEGLGGLKLSSEEATTLSGPILARIIRGSQGVVLCIETHARMNREEALFLMTLRRELGEVPLIVCFTMFDIVKVNETGKTLSNEEYVASAISELIESNMLDPVTTKFCKCSANGEGVKELIALMSRGEEVQTAEVVSARGAFDILPEVATDAKTLQDLVDSVVDSIEILLGDPNWLEFLKAIPVVGSIVVGINFVLKLLRNQRSIIVPRSTLNSLSPVGRSALRL